MVFTCKDYDILCNYVRYSSPSQLPSLLGMSLTNYVKL